MMPRYLVSRSGLRAYASSLITDEITVVLLPDALAAVAAVEQEAGEQSHAHYMDGYAAALDAARDAVAALLSDEAPEYLAKWVWPYGPAQMKDAALAAIAALKEKK